MLVCEDAAYCESCPRRDVVPRLESRRAPDGVVFQVRKRRRSPLSPPSCRRESSARRLLRFAPSWTCISTPAPSSTCERASPYIAAQAPVPYELVDRLLALTTLRVRPHPDFLYEHYRVKLKFNEPLTLFILRNWILVLIGAEMHPPSFPVLEMFLPFN